MHPLNFNLCLIVFCSCFCRSYSQQLGFYNSPEDDNGKYKEWMNATEKRYQQDVLGLSGKNKKYLVELYKERFEMIRKMYDQKEIVTAAEPSDYLQSLFAEIIKSNPALKQLEARVAFSRAWWPNASSMGEGTIVFNIGLFHKLQNESQAAFVICHELAHLYLNHSNNSIDRFVNTVHSEEFMKELKKIEKSEYRQGQQLDALVKTLAFRSRKHSREYEAQADSMALEWMKNTAFDVQEVLSCLNLLDSVDQDKYRVSPAIDKVLNCKEFPFQAKWIKDEQSLFGAMAASTEAEAKKDQDSLKTHPDCSIRVSKLTGKVQQYRNASGRAFVVDEKLFHKLQSDFDYEIIDYCFRSNNISRSFYYTLQMLQVQPGNAYLVTNVGRCLNELYAAQKAHTLSNSVDLPSPYNEKDYNTLLHFIQRVRLPDIAALSYYFLQAHQQNLSDSEAFLAALIDSKANFNKPEEKQQWVERYNKQFPHGKYKF